MDFVLDINIKSAEDDTTPLHLAAKYNCEDAAELLLQHGADVTNALTNGHIPLHVCCRRGHLKLTKVSEAYMIWVLEHYMTS